MIGRRINCLYAKDPNEFNEYYGLDLEKNIISITYDSGRGYYVMFYWE